MLHIKEIASKFKTSQWYLNRKLVIFAFFCLIVLYNLAILILPLHVVNKQLEICQGDSAHKIANSLSKQHIIRSKTWFYAIVRLGHLDHKLNVGFYSFNGYTNMFGVIDKLVSGKSLVNKVTIPEGTTIFKTLSILAEHKVGNWDKFDSLASDTAFVHKTTGFKVKTLEGFLYPATYEFMPNTSEEKALTMMVEEFFSRVPIAKERDQKAFYKAMILASIVEREAKVQTEKPIIASVYLNRLQIGMRLQADPTVTYLQEKEGVHKQVVYYKDLKNDSPYNTYRKKGLPPGPICSPSISAIDAALNPANTNFLFFFAEPAGNHIFTATYEEHMSLQKEKKKL